MYKLREKIVEIKDFVLFKDKLISLKNDCRIPQLPDLDLISLNSEKKYAGDLFKINHLLFWKDLYGKSLVYNLDNGSIIYQYSQNTEIITFRNLNLLANDLLVASSKIQGVKTILLYNINEGNFTPFDAKLSLRARSFEGGKFIMNINDESTEIQKINLNNEIGWTYLISGYHSNVIGEERRNIYMGSLGIYNEIIWVWLSSGDLIGIDQKSGHRVRQIAFDTTIQGVEFNLGGAMQIDSNSSCLIGLWGKYYIEINLNDSNLRVNYTDLSETLDSNSISIDYRSNIFPFDSKSIYFCDDQQGKIGIFDRHKKEVIWSRQLDITREGIAQIIDMKIAKNHWYILDRNHTLHIFEKE